jgi:hypothetical protein
MLTKEQAEKIWRYDPDTGVLFWNEKRSWRTEIDKPAGTQFPSGYWSVKHKGVRYYRHRLAFLFITGAWPVHEVDHINRVPGDDRWCNLRDVPKYLNGHNKHPYKTSPLNVSGVRLVRNRFLARIRVQGKEIHLGSYSSFEDAVKARSLAFNELVLNASGRPIT